MVAKRVRETAYWTQNAMVHLFAVTIIVLIALGKTVVLNDATVTGIAYIKNA